MLLIIQLQTINTFFYTDLTPRLRSVVSEEGLRVLLSLVASDSLPPDVCTPSDNALGGASWSGGRSDVEVEDRFTSWLRFTGVVVDDISDLLSLAVDISGDVPVVAVKWRFSAAQR